MESIHGDVFSDLPHALVEQMIQESKQFSNQIRGILAKVNTDKEELHRTLEDKKMIQHESTICKVPQAPLFFNALHYPDEYITANNPA